LILKYRPAVFS